MLSSKEDNEVEIELFDVFPLVTVPEIATVSITLLAPSYVSSAVAKNIVDADELPAGIVMVDDDSE